MHLPGLGVPVDPWTGRVLLPVKTERLKKLREAAQVFRIALHELDGSSEGTRPGNRRMSLAFTKLDEADSLAPLVGVLREAALPISFVGTGQRVPEDLHRATPPAIAAWVLGEHHLEGAIA